jgi:hypothetical protein
VSLPENELTFSTTDRVNAALQIGMTTVDLSLSVPDVPADVNSTTTPDSRYGSTYVWNNVQDIDSLEVSVSLRPSVRSWVLQTTALVTIALVFLAIAVLTGQRALRGRLSEGRARRRYAVGMGMSAFAVMWSARVGSLLDDPDIVWHLDDASKLAAHWGAALLWLFVGGWITCALLAGSARDGVRKRYPPPPTTALPAPDLL